MSQEAVQLSHPRVEGARTFIGAEFRARHYEAIVVNRAVIALRQRIVVNGIHDYWRTLWDYRRHPAAPPGPRWPIGTALVWAIARGQRLLIAEPNDQQLIEACLARAREGDHVPERGVGALLLGGLDRRVRLRWQAD